MISYLPLRATVVITLLDALLELSAQMFAAFILVIKVFLNGQNKDSTVRTELLSILFNETRLFFARITKDRFSNLIHVLRE